MNKLRGKIKHMKLARRIIIFSILTGIILSVGFGFTFRAIADEWFDSYPKIPWKIETVRLKNHDAGAAVEKCTFGGIVNLRTGTVGNSRGL